MYVCVCVCENMRACGHRDGHTGAGSLRQLELQCPALDPACRLPAVPAAPVAVRLPHAPIAATLREQSRESSQAAAEAAAQQWAAGRESCGIPQVYRGVHGACA